MKKCSICGTEIINGVNGCMMYDTCNTCKPIVYYPTIRIKPTITNYPSYEEMNTLESRCIHHDED